MPSTGVWTAKLPWDVLMVMRVVRVLVVGLGEFADEGVLCGGLGAWQWCGGALAFDTLFNCSTNLPGDKES